jgi:hypothetical protein
MISGVIYYSDHSRQNFLQFCSTVFLASAWWCNKWWSGVSLWYGVLSLYGWQILNIFQVLCVKRVIVKTVTRHFLMLSIPVPLGTGLFMLWVCFLFLLCTVPTPTADCSHACQLTLQVEYPL